MPDIYGLAWKLLGRYIAKTRRQSISKADLAEWRLKALEEATDVLTNPMTQGRVIQKVQHGEQEET